jgi:hypothetical protein
MSMVVCVVAGCNKGPSLEQLQREGYGCSKQGGGAGVVLTAGQHCFVCTTDESMAKCGSNPLTSGCKEADAKECGGKK